MIQNKNHGTWFHVRSIGIAALMALTVFFAACNNLALSDSDPAARSVRFGTANIAPVTVTGVINTALTQDVYITLTSDEFDEDLDPDATSWFSNLPAGLSAEVTDFSGNSATVTISGTPTEVSSFWIRGAIPGDALVSGTPAPIAVNRAALYNILWPIAGNWTASTPFATGSVNATAYGKIGSSKIFLAASRVDDNVAYSINGEDWEPNNIGFGSTNHVIYIAFINNTFYAVGTGGNMAYSTDGIAWEIVSGLLSGNNINSIAYGNSVWVIVGNNGSAASAADPSAAANWTPLTIVTGFSANYNSVVYGGRYFVATGQDATSAYSITGSGAWTDTTDQTEQFFTPTEQSSIKMVAYDSEANKFVAVGFHAAAYVVPTANNFTWIEVENLTDILGSSNKTSWLNCVTFGGDYFVAGGGMGQSICSKDGINWAVTGAQGLFTDDPSNQFVNNIAYNNDDAVYLIGGGLDAGPGIAAQN
jgi:hypothetical protein